MKPFVVRNGRGTELGQLSIDTEGRIDVMVDDDFYSGTLSREESVALAWRLIEWKPAPPTPLSTIQSDTVKRPGGGGSAP